MGYHPDTVLFDLRVNDSRCIPIFLGKDFQAIRDHRHFATEALKRLRQLATTGTRADNDHPARQLDECENSFVGEVTSFSQARNGQFRRSRARGDDSAIKIKMLAVHLDGIRTHKASIADEHINAKLTEPLG